MADKNLQKDMLAYENTLYEQGYKYVAGVDEAGRGPLAGSVYAAAVILPKGCLIDGLRDSKKLSEKKREQLFDVIIDKALAYGICAVDPERIDEINILEATFEAMRGAVDKLGIKPDFVMIDGNRSKGMDDIEHATLIGGDDLSLSIAAASVLAKVSRDRYMDEMAKIYPEYEFEKHKAYGTKLHRELIAKYGPCPIHRKSFKGVKEYVK
ncbi:MAG: ribonuclease HII [Ruminococcaceae bacterium]|nr:ribonuclease HII [Oscillospiraceae bacterium]